MAQKINLKKKRIITTRAVPLISLVNFDLMFTFEETRHATSATVVIKSSNFDEKEVLLTQNTANYGIQKHSFANYAN